MFKKEFNAFRRAESSNIRNSRVKPTMEVRDVSERSDSDMDGELHIHSAANPKYIKENDMLAGNGKDQITVRTENVATKATKINQIQLKVADGIILNTTAYELPNTSKYLLCLADIVDAVGAVVLTKRGHV